jgi:hypothetical protein
MGSVTACIPAGLPVCRDCAFFSAPDGDLMSGRCRRENRVEGIHPITGERVVVIGRDRLAMREREGNCGRNGRFFQSADA